MSISQLNSLRKIKFGTKMRTPHFAALMLFVFFFFFFTLCHETSCSTDLDSENDRLQKLIKSQRTWSSIRDRSWVRMNSKNGFSEVYVGDQDGLMEADKIHTLPGQPQGVAFDQYAGYVTVDPKAGRALFYYFVESPQDASTKPLVLWLNGGPGCSSLGGGAMVELGPFRVNSDGRTLYANDYAWNNVANIIFLESPASVGFSYSNTTSDYQHTGDKRTADDSYAFLINWLERFPEYKKRDFYITGESYAGHYVPELADTILTNNNNSNNTVINLKGIAIGNGYIDGNMNTKANYDYYWTHALISDEAHQAVLSKCGFSSPSYSVECNDAMSVADSELGRIDHYDIYAPRCHLSGARSITTHSVKEVDPCAGNYVTTYLNLPEVQQALHANVTGLPYPWTVCSQFVGWSDWTDGPASMLPTIKKLIDSGIRLWMYSGDVDSVCSVTSTKYSISTLKLDIESSWRPWYTNNQVGGYVVGYEGLAFVTVRGAGHMVPSTQPERALAMITSFLHGELPPTA